MCVFMSQVEESLNDMDFQLCLELYFTDGDYSYVSQTKSLQGVLSVDRNRPCLPALVSVLVLHGIPVLVPYRFLGTVRYCH